MTGFSLSCKTLELGGLQGVGVAMQRLMLGPGDGGEKIGVQWSKEASR